MMYSALFGISRLTTSPFADAVRLQHRGGALNRRSEFAHR